MKQNFLYYNYYSSLSRIYLKETFRLRPFAGLRSKSIAAYFIYIISLSVLYLIFLISIPFVVSAQSPDPAPVNTVLTNFLTLLTLVIQILILSALVVFGWGVVKFIFAASDPKKIEQAKYIILWGIIGIFVLASMGGILAFIKTYLGIPNNSPISVPTFTTFLASPEV